MPTELTIPNTDPNNPPSAEPTGPGTILVWGDIDVTWHYCQSAIDSAGPAKDRSQKRWNGVGTYGLSGLNVWQLQLLGARPFHGLNPQQTDDEIEQRIRNLFMAAHFGVDQDIPDATLQTHANLLTTARALDIKGLDLDNWLPTFGYSIADLPRSKNKGKENPEVETLVLRTKEPLGWSSCDWANYRILFKTHLARAIARLRASKPEVVLLNDAGWGCLRNYFDDKEGAFFPSAGDTQPPNGCTLRSWLCAADHRVFQDCVFLIKSRIYPPIEYDDQKHKFETYASRCKSAPLEIQHNTICIVNASDLRLLGANISRGISWERTVQHLLGVAKGYEAFNQCQQITGLREARYVLVLFSSDGIVLLDREDINNPKATLYFHGPDIEGDTDNSVPGRVYGATTWVSSILAHLLSAKNIFSNGKYVTFREAPTELRNWWWHDALRLCLAFTRDLTRNGNKRVSVKEIRAHADMQAVSFGDSNSDDGKPAFAAWDVEKLQQMLQQFPSWHQYRNSLREYSRGMYQGSASNADEDEVVGRISNARKIDSSFKCIDEFVESQRLRYLRVDWQEINYQAYDGPESEELARRGYPDFFRKHWWSFLSVELHRRARREKDGVSDEEKLGRATVRYACEVLRYGGWDRREYFPYSLSIPYVEFGDLRTCDRGEIEGLRNFSAIVNEYLRRKEQSPLSVAVFGRPGAGKSFGVKEVIRTIAGEREVVFLTFNLSQLQSPAQLPACYQQVQNEVLKGKLPVVFWDEFDTTLDEVDFGWLQTFLSPMQDGTFIHEQRENKIGTSIFVFAGSRFDSFLDLPVPSDSLERPRQEIVTLTFREVLERSQTDDLTPLPPTESVRLEKQNLRHRQELWRVAKGNDFRSRLRGYLDIKGCNLHPNTGEREIFRLKSKDSATCDQLNFLLRRARMVREFLLRNVQELFVESTYPHTRHIGVDVVSGKWRTERRDLPKKPYKELKISNEILFGLLSPYSFIHEMRSVEAILRISELSEKARFERAFIPTADMLRVHIRPDAFDETKQFVEFDSYLADWWSKYLEVISSPTKLGRPKVEIRWINIDEIPYPCLEYGTRWILPGHTEPSELPSGKNRPDRLEVLVHTSNGVDRPEDWVSIAFDRGSPYLLNAEPRMVEKLGIGKGEKHLVFVACRWWRNQEASELSEPLAIEIVSTKGDPILQPHHDTGLEGGDL